jgi:hypothetical protein
MVLSGLHQVLLLRLQLRFWGIVLMCRGNVLMPGGYVKLGHKRLYSLISISISLIVSSGGKHEKNRDFNSLG